MNPIERWAAKRNESDMFLGYSELHYQDAFYECYDALKELEDIHHQYHLAEAKILSRDALIEQLSETQLAKDVAEAEAHIEKLEEAIRFALAAKIMAQSVIDKLDAALEAE